MLAQLEAEVSRIQDGLGELKKLQKDKGPELQGDVSALTDMQQKSSDTLKTELAHVNSRVAALNPSLYEAKHAAIGSAAAIMQRHLIEHLDFHLVDHCNLNCMCCSTYSPLAKKHFADPGDFRKDAERLHDIVGDRVCAFIYWAESHCSIPT